jgi:uncharacterized YigZ family protein
MENKDHYISIAGKTTGEYKEKGSKFIAYVYPIQHEDDLPEFLIEIKKEHPKARHYCYAYRLGADHNIFRANDDGEPSGTAGKPILGAIDSNNLSDVCVIVVRYFGGTKLGVSGLIQAYKAASQEALSIAEKKDVFITRTCKIRFDYSHMGVIMDAVKQLDIEIAQMELDANPYLLLKIRTSLYDFLINSLKALLLNRKVEDIKPDTKIPYCTFEHD